MEHFIYTNTALPKVEDLIKSQSVSKNLIKTSKQY